MTMLDAGGARPLYGNRPGGRIDLDRYLFWASGAKPPSGALVTAAAGTHFVMTKLRFGSPAYSINHLRLHLSGFACTEGGNSPQETVLPGNATMVDGLWISVNDGPAQRCHFGGNDAITVASGANGAWTDDLALDAAVPPDSLVTVYTLYHCAPGEKQIPVYQVEKARGERVWGASDAASLQAMIGSMAPSTAALDTLYGNGNQPAYYGPDMMVAKGWDGRPVVLAVNDSIGERQNDMPQGADERRNKGWLRRWLDKPGGRGRIPHFMMGLPGAASRRELSTSATKRWDVLQEIIAFNGGKWPMTCVLDQLGTNDHQSSYATMKSDWCGLVDRIRARFPAIPVIAVGTSVRTSGSTDNYRTATSQTLHANHAHYRLLDADKAQGMDGLIQGFVDLYGRAYQQSGERWPDAPFVTTLAAAAGTDGSTGYATLRLTDPPSPGDLLRWGINGAQLGLVVDCTGSAGDWLVTLDRSTNVATAAAGTSVFAPATADGTHPYRREIARMAAAVPQSDKMLLR